MSKISLPINMDPPLKCQLANAYPLGIIFTQNENICYPWLFNYHYTFKYTKIHSIDTLMLEPAQHDALFYDASLFERYCIQLPFNVIDKEIIYLAVKNMMEQGYYCAGEFNEKYVPGYGSYGKNDFTHAFLLYGFDLCQNIVNCMGYAQDGWIGYTK